jgi:hypothetical protein
MVTVSHLPLICGIGLQALGARQVRRIQFGLRPHCLLDLQAMEPAVRWFLLNRVKIVVLLAAPALAVALAVVVVVVMVVVVVVVVELCPETVTVVMGWMHVAYL